MGEKAQKKWISLAVLAAGGGIIFQLPYLRYAFYTQLQEALGFSHEQYGNLMTVYAVVAMLSYFPGGWLADRISARKMLTFSFISTGITGFYFATFPSYGMNMLLHAFWGVSTILTYWAALLKVTRTLGNHDEQGRMYGMLEGGRGLASAIAAYALLAVYTKIGEGTYGMGWVINVYSILHIVLGILTWLVIRDPKESEKTTPVLDDIVTVIKMPRVWLLCGVVFTTYSIFAGMTYTPPYLQNVFGASVGVAAAIGIFQRYIMQFLGGAGGGIIADKIGSRTKVLFTGYIIILISLVIFLVTPGSHNMMMLIVANIILMGVTVYVMRGLYFAIVDELEVPLRITGAAVGFASLIGYIPDIYIYKLIGRWLDQYPGIQGYKYMFMFMLATTIIGTVIMYFVKRIIYNLENKREVQKEKVQEGVQVLND
ncbi:nitrate/nitrite transporter [Sebaldella sp. S0638]|uniref:MFS transporter n=1 Tax=Sebaldella sp. S0638 TaxID=2957809 RepID=UPI00209D8869|nr:MFS transporter [Sebaldella sp. S0638]MCP1223629.1 MFS transporter [Sebaldella sp. S0638]